jgi:peptidoglycan/LPS O-acetylase OafA/YrhL
VKFASQRNVNNEEDPLEESSHTVCGLSGRVYSSHTNRSAHMVPARNDSHDMFEPRIAPRALSPAVSAHLDVIRSAAAWAVMWGHLRAFFFIDFPEVSHPNLLLKILYFATGFGHQAVMVFFVLSGFLISSSIFRSWIAGTWTWAGYALSRATRLYVVLIPGLLFGGFWDFTGKSFFNSTGLYSSPLTSFGGGVVQNDLTVRNFVGTLFYLQTILCRTFGSNGPLWSIANEFWYYVLFPLGLLASIRWASKRWISAIALTFFALAVAAFLGPEKLLGFVIWLAGVAVLLLWSHTTITGKAGRAALLFFATILFAACLAAARNGKMPPQISDFVVGFAFSAFLLGILQLDFWLPPDGGYLRNARLFAGFSYTLYVLHFPLLLFLRAVITPTSRWQPDLRHLLSGAGIGIAVLVFCWVVARLTEHRTGEIRRTLAKALPLTARQPSAKPS